QADVEHDSLALGFDFNTISANFMASTVDSDSHRYGGFGSGDQSGSRPFVGDGHARKRENLASEMTRLRDGSSFRYAWAPFTTMSLQFSIGSRSPASVTCQQRPV